MIRVSEKAIYSDWSRMEIGKPVSIIEEKYTAFNSKKYIVEVPLENSDKFIHGILENKKHASTYVCEHETFTNIMNYTIKLENNDVINFTSSPAKYYFRIIDK
jgi:hypothetical protein